MILRASAWVGWMVAGIAASAAPALAATRLEGPTAIPEGSSLVEFRVVDEETGAPTGVTSVWVGGRELRSGFFADARDGRLVVPVPAGLVVGQSIAVAAVGYDDIADSRVLDVIAADMPSYAIYGMTLNGRFDNLIYPSEVVTVSFTLGNVGAVASTGGEIRAASSGPLLEIMQGMVAIPALASGESVTITGLQIRLGANADITDALQLRLNWKAKEGPEGALPRNLRVGRAVLNATVDFGNPANPEDGGIQPGSTGQFYVTFSNTGNDPIREGSVRIRALECAETTAVPIALPTLAPGASTRVEAPIALKVPGTCTAGNPVKAIFEGDYVGQVARVPLSSGVSFPAGVIRVVQQPSPITAPVAIPDANATGIMSTSTVATRGTIKTVSVGVRITHPYIGDLRVRLVHPDGTEIVLHERSGGSNDNLYLTYGDGGTPVATLSNLIGKRMDGAWKLVVSDTSSDDAGTLDSFTLKIKGYAQP